MARYMLALALLILGSPADGAELAKLREVLLRETGRDYGLRVPRGDARLEAIAELQQSGSPEAVGILEEFLTTPGAERKLKIHALVALGPIGSPEAVEAVRRFETWSHKRFAEPPPFHLGNLDYAIDHFAPHALKPLARAGDPQGQEWAVFSWSRYGQNDLWLAAALGKDQWSQPLLLNLTPPSTSEKGVECRLEVQGDAIRVTLGDRKLETTRQELQADADGDGLPDLVEARLGTDPRKKDSDGDGIPDGQDSNPLTPKHTGQGDLVEIRQAVFSVLFATSDSRDAVVIVERARDKQDEKRDEKQSEKQDRDLPKEHFASQEYYGHAGPVLRSPRIRQGFVNVTDLSVKIESPTTATAAISDWEGMLAASGHEIKLRKLHGKWVVVGCQMTWIS